MKTRPLQKKLCVSIITLILFFLAHSALWAAEENKDVLDITIKISNIDEKLHLIEKLIPTEPTRLSFLRQLRELLKGTDWIDPSRSLVFGMIMADPVPEMAVIIPFTSTNPDFQSATNATVGQDYYVFSLPPGSQQEGISETMLNALEEASASKSEDFLTIDAAVKTLLEKGDQKIREFIDKMDALPGGRGGQNLDVSSQDIKDTMKQLIETGKQLETLTESVDLTDEKITVSLNASAFKGTKLAELFVRGPMMTYFNRYEPGEQINFRSGQYDNQGYIDLFGNLFGGIYEKVGIDFSQFSDIMKQFTGEMAGGMSFSRDGISVEMISVLNESSKGNDFAGSTYLPWLENYMKNTMAMVEKESGYKPENVFTRTPDTTVDGQKVVGAKLNFPFGPPGSRQASMGYLPYEMRMAGVDQFFIIAPDDGRMKELISMARNLKEEVYMGDLFKMDMDLGAYMGAIVAMAGRVLDEKDFPKTSKIHFTADAEEGRLLTSSTIRIRDIKTLAGYFRNLSALGKMTSKPLPTVLSKPSIITKRKAVTGSADYWADRGSLCATYGNDEAAVKYYQKALKLDPDRSDVYFHLGISYSELGEFEKAIDAINKSIALDPDNALYHYGRGRTYLQFGKEDKAHADFEFAADKGNKDAMEYLGIEP